MSPLPADFPPTSLPTPSSSSSPHSLCVGTGGADGKLNKQRRLRELSVHKGHRWGAWLHPDTRDYVSPLRHLQDRIRSARGPRSRHPCLCPRLARAEMAQRGRRLAQGDTARQRRHTAGLRPYCVRSDFHSDTAFGVNCRNVAQTHVDSAESSGGAGKGFGPLWGHTPWSREPRPFFEEDGKEQFSD